MIMMTVKAMINFLFYQIWHFAASGSFYYQFHSRLSRDLFCFDFPNTNLHYSLMFFNIKYPLLISILFTFYLNLYVCYLPSSFIVYIYFRFWFCYCCFYLLTWLILTYMYIYIYMILFFLSYSSLIIMSMNEFRKRFHFFFVTSISSRA